MAPYRTDRNEWPSHLDELGIVGLANDLRRFGRPAARSYEQDERQQAEKDRHWPETWRRTPSGISHIRPFERNLRVIHPYAVQFATPRVRGPSVLCANPLGNLASLFAWIDVSPLSLPWWRPRGEISIQRMSDGVRP